MAEGKLARSGATAEQGRKHRRRRRQICQQYASKFVNKSVYGRDRLVVPQIMHKLLGLSVVVSA